MRCSGGKLSGLWYVDIVFLPIHSGLNHCLASALPDLTMTCLGYILLLVESLRKKQKNWMVRFFSRNQSRRKRAALLCTGDRLSCIVYFYMSVLMLPSCRRCAAHVGKSSQRRLQSMRAQSSSPRPSPAPSEEPGFADRTKTAATLAL